MRDQAFPRYLKLRWTLIGLFIREMLIIESSIKDYLYDLAYLEEGLGLNQDVGLGLTHSSILF